MSQPSRPAKRSEIGMLSPGHCLLALIDVPSQMLLALQTAGPRTETAVALPGHQTVEDGYDVYFVADCCGDPIELAHNNAMKRMIQADANAVPVEALSFMREGNPERARRETYAAVVGVADAHYRGYGVGSGYAYTVGHTALQST
jgi:hypothetical protein